MPVFAPGQWAFSQKTRKKPRFEKGLERKGPFFRYSVNNRMRAAFGHLVNRVLSFLTRVATRIAATPLGLVHDRLRWGSLGIYVWRSRRVPGWTRGREAVELATLCHELGGDPVVVEIGTFLGASAILLAGARKLRGSGTLHCVDPFDATGDALSAPFYRASATVLRGGLRRAFDEN